MIKPLSLSEITQNFNKKASANTIPQTQIQPQFLNNTVANTVNKDLVNQNTDLRNLGVIFEKLKGLEGKDFAEKAYSELVKYMGLDGIAPAKITWEKNEGRANIIGDYRFYNNSVVFYTDCFLKVDKKEQLATIAHELTHCKQHTNMLRTEGFSVEKIAYAYAVSDVKAMMVRNPQFIMLYQNAAKNGKGKEFLQMAIIQGTKKTAQEILESQADILKMPRHSLNSENGKKAQQDWIAQYNTNSADLKSYNASSLEKEAYEFEKIISNAYSFYNR